MGLPIWFWLGMAVWLFWSLWRDRAQNPYYPYLGGHLLLFLLIAMLGWKEFGSPVK